LQFVDGLLSLEKQDVDLPFKQEVDVLLLVIRFHFLEDVLVRQDRSLLEDLGELDEELLRELRAQHRAVCKDTPVDLDRELELQLLGQIRCDPKQVDRTI
jgi:hypothetical protein